DHRVKKVVEKSEAVRIAPQKGSSIAIHVADYQFAFLHLRLSRDWSGISRSIGTQCPAADAFFRECIPIIVGNVARIQMQLGVNGGVPVIHGVRILRVQQHSVPVNVLHGLGNQEWGDGLNVAGRIDDRLIKARSLAGMLREKSPGSRVSPEVEIKRAVLLEENEDVLNVLPQQFEFLIVA